MVLYFRDKRPDKHTAPLAWNKSWEDDLKTTYEGIRIRGVPSIRSRNRHVFEMLLPQLDLSYERLLRQVLELQQDLSSYAVQQIATDGFQEKWTRLPRKRREELSLNALVEAASAGPDMEDHRKWCPEMTIDYLAGQGGQGFVTLLEAFFQDIIVEPILVSHREVDKLLQSEPMSFNARNVRLHRAYFMSLTLWRVLLDFYGIEETYISGKVRTHSKRNSHAEIKKAIGMMDKADAQKMRRIEQEYRAKHKEEVDICWTCTKDAAHLAEGLSLKACAGCKPMGRTIYYCSRECQMEDWKNGYPTPHKTICGKTSKERPANSKLAVSGRASKNDVNGRIPPPDAGFKRSAALVHQISFLKKSPFVDYVFVVPPPDSDIGITFPDEGLRRVFLVMRHRALKNGNSSAVLMMFGMLKALAVRQHFPINDLKKQVRGEYGLDVDSLDCEPPNFEPPTQEEIDIVRHIIASNASV